MNNLKELRQDKGLTQAELGALVGVNQAAVSWYENGREIPKRQVKLINDALGVKVSVSKKSKSVKKNSSLELRLYMNNSLVKTITDDKLLLSILKKI